MLSVLLVNPPITVPVDAKRVVTPPLPLLYLAAVLKEGHFDTRIMDCVAEGSMMEAPVEPGFVRIGLTRDEIEMRIANEPSALVGVLASSMAQLPNALLVCEAAKKLRERAYLDISTVVVGPAATASPFEVMADLNVDFVVQGEGEIALFKLCTALNARQSGADIPGVGYRDRLGTATVTPGMELVEDLDQIPQPARWLINMPHYMFGDSPYGQPLTPHTTVVLSRGCPSQCVFCDIPRHLGNVQRKRSPETIFNEIEELRNEYALREVEFIGDNLFHDREWAMEWMGKIVEAGLAIKWSPFDGQSLEGLDMETAAAAVESGMRTVFLDIRSLDPKVYARAYKRPGSMDDLVELIRFFKRNGVRVGGIFQVGVPGETRDSMRRTVNEAFGLGLHELEFRLLTPSPGTPLWDACAENGWFDTVPDAAALIRDGGYLKTSEFTPRDVVWQRDWARTREQARRLALQPGELIGRSVRFLMGTVFYPVTSARTVMKYVSLAAGKPLPGPRPVVRGAPAAAPPPEEPAAEAPPKEEDF
ncbi:MAG: radical SAM protein [Armatimonadetes bacterium]|nr:radical SAM protein [Armatimonadota bacterium]